MSLIAFVAVGLVAGLIARALMPGNQSMGLFMTTGLGIAGSLVGGVLGALLSRRGSLMEFHPTGLVFSVIGSMLILSLVMFANRRPRAH